MSKIFCTGDIHGTDLSRFSKKTQPQLSKTTKDDVLLQTGDFGFIWFHDKHPKYKKDESYLDQLANKSFTTAFVDGNHENFDRLYTYPEKEMWGNKVRVIRDGLYHLKRGHVYNINGVTVFAFGGAKSNDDQKDLNYHGKGIYKKEKLQKSWWPQELPNNEEYKIALKELDRVNWKVDIVLSHTCPSSVIKQFDSYNERVDDPHSIWFESIKDKLSFNKWYFGHFHENMTINKKYVCLYDKISRLK